MNIFVLNRDPHVAARLHNDKHCIKMILESAQLLSTAHRQLDGTAYTDTSATGRRLQRWRHPDPECDRVLLKATHVNHPCTVWVRSHGVHYQWLYGLFVGLLDEYTLRYHKAHAYSLSRCPALHQALSVTPTALQRITTSDVAPPQAMPDQYKVMEHSWDATVQAYHQYYRGAKAAFSTWKHQAVPSFMQEERP